MAIVQKAGSSTKRKARIAAPTHETPASYESANVAPGARPLASASHVHPSVEETLLTKGSSVPSSAGVQPRSKQSSKVVGARAAAAVLAEPTTREKRRSREDEANEERRMHAPRVFW